MLHINKTKSVKKSIKPLTFVYKMLKITFDDESFTLEPMYVGWLEVLMVEISYLWLCFKGFFKLQAWTQNSVIIHLTTKVYKKSNILGFIKFSD